MWDWRNDGNILGEIDSTVWAIVIGCVVLALIFVASLIWG